MKLGSNSHITRQIKIKGTKKHVAHYSVFPADLSPEVKELVMNTRKLSVKLGITGNDIERSISGYRKANRGNS